jgi:serine/threonine-protein kinase PknG
MTPCQRPGCTGHYAPDGYCDECGHKAPAGIASASSGGGAAGGGTGGGGTGGGGATAGGRSGTAAPTGAQRAASSVSAATVGASVGFSASTGSRFGATSTSGSTGRRTRGRGRLGANLVTIAPVPLRDPSSAVLTNPSVPESQRFCSSCHEPVGRSHDGQPGRTDGFCPRDRTPYSFVPALSPGDVIDKRYEILGALAHGGLGWIYLGRDRNISDAGSDRWVVLKGLINRGDADAMAAAVAERHFLVEVDHPNIVKIHDFANHPDPVTGEIVGYIVMEYVGGRSLKELALAHRGPDGRREPLSLPEVLAYGIEVLPALGYLHDRGLLFCDFKPDNVIHAEEQLKLIDLGAVRRVDDDQSALYGTPGYQAPELATAGPSVGSDLYTVGRTLAVLSFDFAGFTARYAEMLPPQADVAVLAAEESYYRLVQRATHRNRNKRFASASDMADQLLGVLREVLSAADGLPRPSTSTLFGPGRRTFGPNTDHLTGADVAAALPVPLVDPTDPNAAVLATLTASDTAQTIRTLRGIAHPSIEASLALTRAHLEANRLTEAVDDLRAATREAPNDWRIDWYRGLIALALSDYPLARSRFDEVYAALPGEVAPRLALAAALELVGDMPAAARLYERVWRVDHEYPSAAFGLARTRAAADDHAGAIAVLDEVPDTSIQHIAAQVAALRTRLNDAASEADLVDASSRLQRLRLDAERQATLSVEMFRTALAWLGVTEDGAADQRSGDRFGSARAGGRSRAAEGVAAAQGLPAPARAGAGPSVPAQRSAAIGLSARVLGQRLTERDLRLGLERAYRVLAAMQTDTLRRYALVDRANAVRPWTMV